MKPGETISLDETAAAIPVVEDMARGAAPPVPNWLHKDGTSGKVTGTPEREDIEGHIQEHLIVEFYSR